MPPLVQIGSFSTLVQIGLIVFFVELHPSPYPLKIKKDANFWLIDIFVENQMLSDCNDF